MNADQTSIETVFFNCQVSGDRQSKTGSNSFFPLSSIVLTFSTAAYPVCSCLVQIAVSTSESTLPDEPVHVLQSLSTFVY